MADELSSLMSKKVGPVPVPVIGIAAVAVGWYLYKRHKGAAPGGSGGAGGAAGDQGGPNASSQPSGNFTGNYTQNGQGYSSSGPLLTGGFVGQPPGYPGSNVGGDIYVNVPGQTTTQSATAQTYTVQTGDTLQKIAAKIWGASSLWHQLYAANSTAIGGNPGTLAPGTVLTLPVIDPSTSNMPTHDHDNSKDNGDHRRNREQQGPNRRYDRSSRYDNSRGER